MPPSDRTPPADLVPLLETAAGLRALGNSWAVVALRVGRTERAVRRWKTVYRRTWNLLFREAEDDLFTQVAAMAVTVMSSLVLDKDDPNRSRNCQFMIARRREAILAAKRMNRRANPPPLDRYWLEMIAKVEGKNPQQLEQEILDYATKLRARDGDEPAGAPAAPGPARPE